MSITYYLQLKQTGVNQLILFKKGRAQILNSENKSNSNCICIWGMNSLLKDA